MARTRNETLQHILDELEAGRLGAIDPDDESRCVYKGAQGNFCVVGCLLTEEQHSKISSKNAEGFSVGALVDDDDGFFSIDEIAPEFTVGELGSLQNLHDAWARPSGWFGNTTPKEIQREELVKKVKSMMI